MKEPAGADRKSDTRRKEGWNGRVWFWVYLLLMCGVFLRPFSVCAASPKKVSLTEGKTRGFSEKYYKQMGEILCNYRRGNSYYVISRQNHYGNISGVAARRIYITKYNRNFKLSSVRTITLPKYSSWGGFYKGPDGNFYIAIGNINWTDKKKTVIQVLKYNNNWKHTGTCRIYSKGKSDIRTPFNDSISMEGSSHDTTEFSMVGNSLYLTSSIDYYEPGYISLIGRMSWVIDTKTMRAKRIDSSYGGGYYGTRIQFRNGLMYAAGLGPESMELKVSVTENYDDENKQTKDFTAFKLTSSANYMSVYANLSEMEVCGQKVLTCGKAQPNSSKIKGCTGVNGEYANNIYLTVTDTKTGQSKVKWITKYNPKIKRDPNVSEPQMIRLSDTRFAILFDTCIYQKGELKSTLHYYVVDENGKVVYKKLYKNYHLNYIENGLCTSKPVLMGKYIYWSANDSINIANRKIDFFRIPVGI